MSLVTFVMYHYVRDLKKSRFPDIKGLDISDFRKQIEYLKKNYEFIAIEELIAAIDGKCKLPRNSVLLTFDDGYKDHYEYVFPILDEFKIQGCFYIPALPVKEKKVLDVNKIHFVLAAVRLKNDIVKSIFKKLDTVRKNSKLEDNEFYYAKYAQKNRFDSENIVFIKTLLQVGLPQDVRRNLIDELFREFVGIEEDVFCRELYADLDQIKCMQRNGMHIGCHGYSHRWLNALEKPEQEREIDLSLEFLKEVGCDLDNWTMSYPSGVYDETLIDIIQQKNCKVAFTTEVGIANYNTHSRYELPRLDANDIQSG